MIKVLLLDDEKLALEYLETIVSWEMYGFEIVDTLTDAEQALKVYRKTRPDLVISDICMYGMDGLDFASAIREIDQNTHILFLSGYKNFDYVQEALRLGIDDYLLKSDIDEEIFLSKILKIKEKIEKERQKNQYTEGTIFKELFTRNTEEKEYKDILSETEYIRLHKKYYYIILHQKKIPVFLEEYFSGINSENYMDEMSLKSLLQKQAEILNIKNPASFLLNRTELLAVLEIKGGLVSQKEIYEQLYQLAAAVFSAVNRIDKNKYNVYYYPKGCAVRQFGQYYREKRGQIDQCYVKKEPQIAEFEMTQSILPQTGTKPQIYSEEICQAIKDRNPGRERDCIEALMIAIEQEDYIAYLWYLKEIMKALGRTEVSLKNGRGFSLAASVNQYDLSDPQDTVKFVRSKFEEIEKLYEERQDGAYSKAVGEAISYLQENYAMEELSTNLVARQVNLSTSWLSTKFKEEVGIGISDYLNNIRIQQARKLFDEQDYMIYEVAEKVGFASSQYFSKMFKQVLGLTPNEYKRKS